MPEKESLSLRGESSANRRLGGFHGVRPFSIPIVPFDPSIRLSTSLTVRAGIACETLLT